MAILRVLDRAIRVLIDYISPHRATGAWLRLHGVWAGVEFRASPRATRGFVHVTSTTGGTMPAGTELSAGGQVYRTDSDATLSAGIPAAVAITATVAGAAGNVAAGAEVEFEGGEALQPADVVAQLRADWVTWYGYDADDLDDPAGLARFRERVVAGLAVRGVANIEARYRLFAIGVPGVSSVAMARTPRDYGSADLAFLVEGRLPSDNDIALVRAALAREVLITRDLWIRAPRVVPVAVTAEIVSGDATPAEVAAEIERWWRSNIGIGDGVELQQLYRRATARLTGVVVEYSSPVTGLDGDGITFYEPSISVTRAA